MSEVCNKRPMLKSSRHSKQVKNYKNKFEDRTVVISKELYYGNDIPD